MANIDKIIERIKEKACNIQQNTLPYVHICAYIISSYTGKCVYDISKILPTECNGDISVHAEITSLAKLLRVNNPQKISKKLNKRLITVNIIVLRVSKTGILGDSKPCYECMKKLISNPNIKINEIIYSTSDNDYVVKKFKELTKEFIESGNKVHMTKNSRKKLFEKHGIDYLTHVKDIRTLEELFDFLHN